MINVFFFLLTKIPADGSKITGFVPTHLQPHLAKLINMWCGEGIYFILKGLSGPSDCSALAGQVSQSGGL